jgi:zinc transporter, ZIP family
LIDYLQLLLLATIAGFTIFLGLPVAFLQNLSQKKKGFLSAFALGILVFLIIDVVSHAWATTEEAASGTFRGKSTILNAAISLSSMFGGLGIRLLGLTWYESKYMNRSVKLHHRFGVRKMLSRQPMEKLGKRL